jgi:hypothetical protein
VDLANLGSESETCVGSRVRLVGVPISLEKIFYRLPFTPPSLVRCIGPSRVLPWRGRGLGEEPTFSGYGKSYRATELKQEEKSKNNNLPTQRSAYEE